MSSVICSTATFKFKTLQIFIPCSSHEWIRLLIFILVARAGIRASSGNSKRVHRCCPNHCLFCCRRQSRGTFLRGARCWQCGGKENSPRSWARAGNWPNRNINSMRAPKGLVKVTKSMHWHIIVFSCPTWIFRAFPYLQHSSFTLLALLLALILWTTTDTTSSMWCRYVSFVHFRGQGITRDACGFSNCWETISWMDIAGFFQYYLHGNGSWNDSCASSWPRESKAGDVVHIWSDRYGTPLSIWVPFSYL